MPSSEQWPNNYERAMRSYVYVKPINRVRREAGPRSGIMPSNNTETEPFLASLVSQKVMMDAVAQSERALAGLVAKYAKSLKRNVNRREDLQMMHKDLARAAQAAILQAYDEGQDAREGAPRQSYRFNDPGKMMRYSNKRMRKGLGDPLLFRADAVGIGAVNTRMLDSIAKQWYRLNFGALPNAKMTGYFGPFADKNSKTFGNAIYARMGVAGQGTLKILGMASQNKINISKYGPSKPFFVPNSPRVVGVASQNAYAQTPAPGDFRKFKTRASTTVVDRSRRQYIYVYGKGFKGGFNPVMARGIAGTQFLNAGVKVINDNYGTNLTYLIKKWEAAARGIAFTGINQRFN
jgi:hypothetical protein